MAEAGELNLQEIPSSGCRSVHCYEKMKMLGQGTYGEVFKARDKQSGEIVALKKLRLDNERDGFPVTALREITILKLLKHHPNIVQLKEIVTDNENQVTNNKHSGITYMVFEYMDHDLAGLLQRQGVRFSIPQIKCYMLQLLRALHYCHQNNVLHRDIKTANLLIDNNGVLKLADFGLSRTLNTDKNLPGFFSMSQIEDRLTNRVITQWYRPPELLLGSRRYDSAVDMWSVGCIFGELLNHGHAILQGQNEVDQLNKIYELCGSPDESNWPGVSELPLFKKLKPRAFMGRRVKQAFKHVSRQALELLERMLALDPSMRISAKDALNSEYFFTEPLPAAPNSLPRYESSHFYQSKIEQGGGMGAVRQKGPHDYGAQPESQGQSSSINKNGVMRNQGQRQRADGGGGYNGNGISGGAGGYPQGGFRHGQTAVAGPQTGVLPHGVVQNQNYWPIPMPMPMLMPQRPSVMGVPYPAFPQKAHPVPQGRPPYMANCSQPK